MKNFSNIKLSLIISFSLISIPLHATEVLWLKLTPIFTYKDINKACTNNTFIKSTPQTLYFAAEVEGTKVSKAVLRDRPTNDFLKSIRWIIDLTPEEVNDIEIYQDKVNRSWIKSFPLSGRLLNWIFFHTSSLEVCDPSAALKTLDPQPFFYTFNVEEIGMIGPASIESQMGIFKGRLANDDAYVISLSFIQKQMKLSEP